MSVKSHYKAAMAQQYGRSDLTASQRIQQ